MNFLPLVGVPELVADVAWHTGENPLWHPDERVLYWTDIPAGRLYRYDPATGAHELVHEDAPVGGFTVQADGALLLFMANGAIATWRDGRLSSVIDELPGERDTRFNDVIADPEGRVFCGTMPTARRPGRLHRLDRDGSIHQVLDGLGIPNGLGFTPDGAHLYHTDTTARTITRYAYDRSTGEIGDPSVFLTLPEDDGVPDGLTVDAEGCVWSARWDGGALHRYDTSGHELARIDFPCRKVSSLTFGGSGLTDIYVTTAGGPDRAGEGKGAGGLFRLQSGVVGLPEHRSRILL